MRIALVSRGWWPSIKGGSERFISKLGEELSRRGYEVIGVTRWFRGDDRPEAPHKLIIREEERALPLISSYVFSRWAAKVVNSLSPDAVIVNTYWGETSPTMIRDEIPIIAIIHDVGLLHSGLAKKHKFRHALRMRALRKVTRRVDKIIVPTKRVMTDLTQYFGVEPRRIRVLGFEGVEGPFKRVLIENECFDLLQVGRFAPNKGQLITLEAFKLVTHEMPNVKLWLVGGKGLTSEHLEYLERVREAARKINDVLGRKAVEVVVDAPDVSKYYELADACIMSSIGEEGYGLTVVECMAYGKPVIASDVFKETGVASEERAFIYPRGNARELARLILHVYRNPEDALTKAERGLEYARRCSWGRVAEIFEEEIESVMKSKTR